MTSRLKIAVASSGLGHVSRGIEAWADDLATALAERGEDVLLCKGAGPASRPFERVVSCWKRDEAATQRLLRFLPKRLFWRFGFGCPYATEQTTFALNLIPLLRREQVDILHVQDPQVASLTQKARSMGLIRTKTILAHGTEESPNFLKGVHYLQQLAPWHIEDLKAAGVWKPAWTAIPNFIDTERFHPGRADELRQELGIPSDGLVVLSAAAIKRHHKRIDYLVSEFANLRNQRPDLPVWLVVAGGKEAETDEVIAEGERLLGDRVRFLVKFPRERMPDLYRAADVFTLCSLFEMMPIALIEATASGLPCLTHEHPILSWMTGEGGVRLNLAEKGTLASELASLLNDPIKRKTLGSNARSHCLANFARDAVVDRILEYYKQVLSAPALRKTQEQACASA